MWKKLQTWIIVAVAALTLCMFGLEMCYTVVPETGEHFAIKFTDNARFMVYTFVVFMVTVIMFFHYDKRLMQIRLCILNSLLLLGYQLWILVAFFKIHAADPGFALSIGSLIPLICIILLMVAARLILKDEATHAFDLAIEKHAKKKK